MKRIVFLTLLLLLVLLIAPAVFLVIAMEPEPIVAQRIASTPRDAGRTREILREVRALTDSSGDRKIRISQTDMNGMLAFSTRALPRVRGQARVSSNAVWLKMSADARPVPGGGWINLQTIVRPSSTGLKLDTVRIGSFNLPAGIILPVLGYALDIALGDDLGQIAVQGVNSLAIQDRAAIVGIGLTTAQRKALVQRTKETVRSAVGVSSPEQVRVYYAALDEAAKTGQLPRRGSVLPFLRFAMEHAHKRATQGDAQEEVKAGLLALAIYCGHPKFQTIIGDVISKNQMSRKSRCAATTMGGRVDLRQHFTISAGLKAAGDGTIAFAIGEFKELLDSNKGGSGFSFDDLAADRAGIRFADAFLTASSDQRDAMLARMVAEEALLPRVDDLISGMSEQEFKRRFGDVNSPAYKQAVSDIDNRINRLQVFAVP